MRCNCHASNCRGMVRNIGNLSAATVSSYRRLGIVPDFILATIRTSHSPSMDAGGDDITIARSSTRMKRVKRHETSCTHLALPQSDFEAHLQEIPDLRNPEMGFTIQRWQSRRLAFFQGPLSASISNPRSRPGRDARRYRLERLIVDPDETFDSTRCDR